MQQEKRPKIRRRTSLIAGLFLVGGLAVAMAAAFARQEGAPAREVPPSVTSNRAVDSVFDGERAYEYLKQVVAIGPRPSGSEAMRTQQKMLAEHFRQFGGKVAFQSFRARHPRTGRPVSMANSFVQWHPERKQRILLCAHYDTRPFPDQDPVNPRGRFVGANDGGSGVAVLMELAHHMPELECNYGIDFMLFDGEEFVWTDDDRYFLGSEFFARSYAENPPSFRYEWGVLLDMVGDADLQIYQELNSIRWRDTRPLVNDIWRVAAELGVREFIDRGKYEIRDDHLALRNIARIPTCDIIDFDYPAWHTEADTAKNCSADSLGKVGSVILAWLEQVR